MLNHPSRAPVWRVVLSLTLVDPLTMTYLACTRHPHRWKTNILRLQVRICIRRNKTKPLNFTLFNFLKLGKYLVVDGSYHCVCRTRASDGDRRCRASSDDNQEGNSHRIIYVGYSWQGRCKLTCEHIEGNYTKINTKLIYFSKMEKKCFILGLVVRIPADQVRPLQRLRQVLTCRAVEF